MSGARCHVQLINRDFLHFALSPAALDVSQQDCLLGPRGEKVAVVRSLSGCQVMQHPSGAASTGKLGLQII